MQPTGWHELWFVLWNTTWGNNTAWLESLIIMAIVSYAFKDYIGKALAKFWHKHHSEHAIANHLEAMRRYARETNTRILEEDIHEREREAE
jgi:hypothetical protein